MGSVGIVREYRGYKGIHVLLVSTSTTNTHYKLPIPLYLYYTGEGSPPPSIQYSGGSLRGWWADTRYTQVYREYMVLVVRGQQDYSIYGYRGNTPRNTLLLEPYNHTRIYYHHILYILGYYPKYSILVILYVSMVITQECMLLVYRVSTSRVYIEREPRVYMVQVCGCILCLIPITLDSLTYLCIHTLLLVLYSGEPYPSISPEGRVVTSRDSRVGWFLRILWFPLVPILQRLIPRGTTCTSLPYGVTLHTYQY